MARPVTPLDAIATASALLRQHPCSEVRRIGGWLAAGATSPLMEALGHPNEPGYSSRLGLALPERDRLLRQLASPNHGARRIASELEHYRATQWKETCMAAECPHPEGSREALMWRVFWCRDWPLSVRQLQQILSAV